MRYCRSILRRARCQPSPRLARCVLAVNYAYPVTLGIRRTIQHPASLSRRPPATLWCGCPPRAQPVPAAPSPNQPLYALVLPLSISLPSPLSLSLLFSPYTLHDPTLLPDDVKKKRRTQHIFFVLSSFTHTRYYARFATVIHSLFAAPQKDLPSCADRPISL